MADEIKVDKYTLIYIVLASCEAKTAIEQYLQGNL